MPTEPLPFTSQDYEAYLHFSSSQSSRSSAAITPEICRRAISFSAYMQDNAVRRRAAQVLINSFLLPAASQGPAALRPLLGIEAATLLPNTLTEWRWFLDLRDRPN